MSSSRSPSCSVVVPTYRRPARLRMALASAAAQTDQDFEVIVVNNDVASAEAVEAATRGLAIPIHVLHNEVNIGQSASRNRGAAHAHGELIALLDDDDTWLPTFIEEHRARHAQLPQAALVYSGHYVVWSDIPLVPRLMRAPPPPADLLRAMLSGDFTLATNSTVTVKRAAWERVGGYDPAIRAFGDWDFQVRIAQFAPFGHIPQPLVNFGNALTGRELNPEARLAELRAIRERWRAYPEIDQFVRRFSAQAYYTASFAGGFAGRKREAIQNLARYALTWGPGWELRLLAQLTLLNLFGPRFYKTLQAWANSPLVG